MKIKLDCRHLRRRRRPTEAVKPNGAIVMFVLVFGAIGLIILGGLVRWGTGLIKVNYARQQGEIAFQIAEAGINYYRWHLAHAPNDYQDGTGLPGPYLHQYRDRNDNLIGYFSLNITPPPVSSTLVMVESTGYTTANTNLKRIIQAQFAIPSIAKYAVVADDIMRFGEGTTIYGPIHSNNGIRFDGLAYNLVTSAKSSYDDPDHSGGLEFGVHTHVSPVDPLPAAAVPSRPDVFKAGRQFPVPAIDFNGMSANLSTIKSQAQANGRYFAASGYLGYRLVLKTDNTFDLYRVRSLRNPPGGCANVLNQSGWGTWSIGTSGSAQTFLGNYANPANNLIFVEDNLWLEGQIAAAHLTIASAKFPDSPSTNTSITINDNLLYSAYNGSNTIGLIAQKNINVGLYSADNLQIDAALVAQNGRIGRYYYGLNCGSTYLRSQITLNGMIASRQRYGFAYTDGTGYQTRNINYDANLLYAPPPSFPLTSDQYSLINWKIIR